MAVAIAGRGRTIINPLTKSAKRFRLPTQAQTIMFNPGWTRFTIVERKLQRRLSGSTLQMMMRMTTNPTNQHGARTTSQLRVSLSTMAPNPSSGRITSMMISPSLPVQLVQELAPVLTHDTTRVLKLLTAKTIKRRGADHHHRTLNVPSRMNQCLKGGPGEKLVLVGTK